MHNETENQIVIETNTLTQGTFQITQKKTRAFAFVVTAVVMNRLSH